MSSRRRGSETTVETLTYDFLWRAANVMHSATPSVSQHLGASLIHAVPPNGMSSFASRMHCIKCGALMSISKVRICGASKRSNYNNRVFRTCAMCGWKNIEHGALKGTKPVMGGFRMVDLVREQMEEGDADKGTNEIDKTKEAEGKGKKRKKKESNDTTRKGEKVASGKKKKRRRNSSTRLSIDSTTRRRSSLAASFLFEPL